MQFFPPPSRRYTSLHRWGLGLVALLALVTQGASAAPQSDDFNSSQLAPFWTFSDPLGGASFALVGAGSGDARLELAVPGGLAHEGNDVVEVVQPSADVDFEVEIKFESDVGVRRKDQGIRVIEDPNRYMRFLIYGKNNGITRITADTTTSGSSTSHHTIEILPDTPVWMRVSRSGDVWTHSYSYDGQAWVQAGSPVTEVITVSEVSIFAGNGGLNPAHTAMVDYFFNTASPFVPEDGPRCSGPGPFPLSIGFSGTGTGAVVANPDLPSYDCGAVVTLTALPDAGSSFGGWSGDATGLTSPVDVLVEAAVSVTADFVADLQAPTISNIQIAPGTDSALVTWTTDEAATSRVDAGIVAPGEVFAESAVLTTSHSLVLTGLASYTTYLLDVSSVDGAGNLAAESTSFTTLAPGGCATPGPFVLSLSFSGSGSGSVIANPDQPTYACGELVTLTATPDPGSAFGGWSGDASGADNPLAVMMSDDRSVTADFPLDTQAPTISNVQVVPGDTLAFVTWTTDEPATSRIDYGVFATNEDFAEDGTLVTSHSLTLTGLVAETSYLYSLSSVDASGNVATTSVASFMTLPAGTGGPIQSDDFNSSQLAPFWTFSDPLGGASFALVGAGSGDARLELAVPGGLAHEGNDVVEVVQPSADVDFEVEIKFESDVGVRRKDQGIRVIEDPNRYMRFLIYGKNNGITRITADTTTSGSSTSHHTIEILPDTPVWMRVSRSGDVWTHSYSYDGQAWVQAGSPVTEVITVSEVSIFAGNGGLNPAHTAMVDYFFNTASPFVPEDGPRCSGPGPFPLSIGFSGTGTGAVVANPDLPSYDCGAVVTLTALPDAGSSFGGWSGDATGLTSPVDVLVEAAVSVTADFVADLQAPTISNIQIAPGTDSALVTWTTDEAATSRVDAGIVAPGEVFAESAVLTTSHSLVLTGLASYTTYLLDVSSVDGAGNLAAESASFTTLAPGGCATPGPFVLSLSFSGSGSGSVTANPDQPTYACGELVTLTATPDPGSAFGGWSGDASGADNPLAVMMSDDRSVTADFPLDTQAPTISNVQVVPGDTLAFVTWTTDEPATSRIDYGVFATNEDFAEDGTLVTSHSLTLTGLVAETSYLYSLSSVDASGNVATTSVASFMTLPAGTGGPIQSDDFNSSQLAPFWTFSDPLGGASFALVGAGSGDARLELAVPGGLAHEGNDVVEVVQPSADVDFEVEIKFESDVGVRRKDQGIRVIEDPNRYMRFLIYGKNNGITRITADTTTSGSSTSHHTIEILPDTPVWMRVSRSGDVWTHSYSYDGQAWVQAGSPVTEVITVSEVSIFAGNGGLNPAHTAMVDYFFNTAAPVSPEDPVECSEPGPFTLTITSQGNGSVQRAPDQPTYDCAATVTLTAVPDPDWNFDSWSGDINGNLNPFALTVGGDLSVTAQFSEDAPSGNGPVFELFEGNAQSFGQLGLTQTTVNIVGNVSDPDGVASLQYSLNGGALQPLTLGLGNVRLVRVGDFNVDIPISSLQQGSNDLELRAQDNQGDVSFETVAIDFTNTVVPPLVAQTFDWSGAAGVTDVAQVVDGKWVLDGSGARILETGYDRLLAIGDLSWTDFEVTAEFRVHSIADISISPFLGMATYWNGHIDWAGEQPDVGWNPGLYGGLGGWRWLSDGCEGVMIIGTDGDRKGRNCTVPPIQLESPTKMKFRGELQPSGEFLYKVKVWDASAVEPDWQLEELTGAGPATSGSLLLILHHVDATWDALTITPF